MAELPCGAWPSSWSASDAAAASRDFAELRAGLGGLLWLTFDPAEAACSLWLWRAGAARRLTPAGFSVRSRVYEYGGGAFCVLADGVALVGEADQQVWHLPVAADGTPGELRALSAHAERRYGDLHCAPAWQAVLAVEESRESGAVRHRLVSLDPADGARRVLVEGADFYSAPRVSPDGRWLAWIEWDRPELPWTATRLCRAALGADGRLGPHERVAGGAGDESLQQPGFAADGRLTCLSDRDGWWQPWHECGGRWQAVGTGAAHGAAYERGVMPVGGAMRTATAHGAQGAPYAKAAPSVGCALRTSSSGASQDWSAPRPMAQADHAPAPWQLGTVSHLPLAGGGWLLARLEEGWGQLVERDAAGRERCLAGEFSRFRQLAADDRHFYCIAAAPERLPAVLAVARASGAVQVLAGGEQPLAEAELSRPASIRFATGAGESAQAFFYPPRNAACAVAAGERPPLVLFLHGGPTSACYPVFDPRIQFWTQRGFAVADLNYRGSSGFGRACRLRLAGAWGEIEVEDAVALVRHLGAAGLVDPARAFIRGASAGGYTALCALAFHDCFRGGASLYGVSDPLALRRATHKFEGDYLDWLIGDPVRDAERYAARTPLRHAGRIRAPLIFFQGGLDAVVVPEQTAAMVAALQGNGVPVDCHLYPDERHGFRQAAHLADALQREWEFYRRQLA
ncbi:S9 family peptidase [Pseudomonas oryzae]|uniref:Prolyl oligopeptidase family protein n=1 Tax=Pseudomonas oryzae TaxID=1392877 RepID=A0A1H1ZDA6_9PSED|nr:S9 family peptidase [Pseudomonas oryzae]SDT31714.1 Prolyl oligopeptidase family protein [Pseudomonas oryzae]